MATSGSIDVQRAALNYVSTLCQDKNFKGVRTPQLLELLLSAFLSPSKETDTLLQIKVCLYHSSIDLVLFQFKSYICKGSQNSTYVYMYM